MDNTNRPNPFDVSYNGKSIKVTINPYYSPLRNDVCRLFLKDVINEFIGANTTAIIAALKDRMIYALDNTKSPDDHRIYAKVIDDIWEDFPEAFGDKNTKEMSSMNKPEWLKEPQGKIENAKITNVSLNMEAYGTLTFDIAIQAKGWSSSFGGHCIGYGMVGGGEFEGAGFGLEAMMRIMDTVGVSKWEDLKGKYIRVYDTEDECGCSAIGNIMEDKWFNIDAFFKEKRKE